MTLNIPLWAIPILVCTFGFYATCRIIGPSPKSHPYPDIVKPYLKLAACLAWTIVGLAAELVLALLR